MAFAYIFNLTVCNNF